MQKAFIIIIMVMFVISTIGFYFAAIGSPEPSSRQQRDEREAAAEPDVPEAEGFDIPEYVQQPGVDFREVVDATDQDQVGITIGDNYFETTVLRIEQGTTVTWRNQGDARHSVVSDEASAKQGLGSDLLTNGQEYTYTFDETGLYEYFCEPHPASMKGAVKVVEAS